jgi:hypothetical protein
MPSLSRLDSWSRCHRSTPHGGVTAAGFKMASRGAHNASLVPIFVLIGIWFVAGWFIQRRQRAPANVVECPAKL